MPQQVTLRPITQENANDIMKLAVTNHQQNFVADNTRSLAQAHFSDYAWYRAIYADDTPVGFLMLYDNAEKPTYFLWRLMVDANHQGHGYGRKAVEQLVEYVKTRPQANELFVSYVPGEGSPGEFYRKLGFSETGDVQGEEVVMRLPIEPDPEPANTAPLTHIVLFRLKDNSPENMAEVRDELLSMRGQVPTMRKISVGYDIVRAKRSADIALITHFDDLAGMEAYQVHPVHKEIVTYMHEKASEAIAVDFES